MAYRTLDAEKRVIRAPKLFLVDPALALAAAREHTATGFHLENLVAVDLAVWKDSGPARALHHWRLPAGQEVDFVLESGGRLLPVEVKASTRVGTNDIRHLRRFREHYPNAPRGVLLSCDPAIQTLGPGIIAAPWWAVV